MSDALIDWEQLEMIFGEEEDEFDEDMAELFQEFVEDATGRFETIKGTDFGADKETIAKESHKLKGSAANFGFTEVASQLANIENNIDTISQDEYAGSLEKAEAAFGQSKAEVEGKYPALVG
ncbi:MAG: Hpt domain-containing protein [Verrucomicrobiota bacterium]